MMTTSWETSTPRRVGLSTVHLEKLSDRLAQHGTKSFLVARDGQLVYEWYAPERGPETRHFTASLAKSLVGGMSLLLAWNDGLIDPDAPAADFIPAWRDDPLKCQITIRHLAAHASGLEDAETPGKGHFDQGGWKEQFWRQDPDPFSLSLYTVPVMFTPGSRLAYSNPGFAALSYTVTASLKDAPQKNIRSLLQARLMEPLGIPAEEWSIGYGKTFCVDGLELHATWGGAEFTPRAAARVGQLLLQGGQWQSQTLLDSQLITKATQQIRTPLPDHPDVQPAAALAWWSNAEGVWPFLPRDAFLGLGAQHQILLVVPSRGLVVVRNGQTLGNENWGSDTWESLTHELLAPLADCFLPSLPGDHRRAPYPPSPVIKTITFDPVTRILRRAFDSDNWPVTWAADGHLYAAYGDGRGFEPYVESKIGLGLTRIQGDPPEIQGINLRAPSLENAGYGARGIKASGLLSVNGRLYLLGRNAGNSQLAWSDDSGKTWQWSPWKFTESFGYPTFLNFGQDYSGARDTYVYIYSHDGNSAYIPADRMVLARVPIDRVTEREAYTFFVRLDDSGEPVWSEDIRQRGAVFTHPGLCARSGISYHPVLKRYLWWQEVPAGGEVDVRFSGGFGIYDAPEPWGPWTTAYFTTQWDTGPGEMANFPTKWFSPDGQEAYLVFSGYDYFSLRRCKFHLR